MAEEKLLRIGEMTKETGRTARTLRYYEELGLLQPAGHTEGGFRLYRAEDVGRVQFIARLQELGLQLSRIRRIVSTWQNGKVGEQVSLELTALLYDSLREVQRRQKKLREVERDILETLSFLATCRSCQEEVHRQICSDCEKGDHKRNLPRFVEALVQ